MKKYSSLLLAILSGLLFWIAWTPNNFSAAIFFAFIPLLIIEERESKGLRYFIFVYAGLLLWNLFTTWWIWNSTMIGAWLAIAVNSLLMFFPWWSYRKIKKQFNINIALCSLLIFWLSFEYIHQLDWGLSWPWLTLGNAFAERILWIQWYEYTGTSGGSLWILLVNILLYKFYLHNKENKIPWNRHIIITLCLILPIIISLFIEKREERKYISEKNKSSKSNIVIVQPNIDPYEKISSGDLRKLSQSLADLSEQKIDSNTTLLIWPETALYAFGGIDETSIRENADLQNIFSLLKRYPKLHLFTGIESYRIFPEKHSIYSRPMDGSGNYYEVYNGAMLADSNGAMHFYHKSMLVPGVETLPKFLLFLGPVFEKLGGTAGGYARQEIRTAIPTKNHYVIAPAICYESIYGEFISKYIKNGASIIAIITNDGWWGNTPGHQQHIAYARLRAIESRKWVVRSANTGISAFINPIGEIEQSASWWKAETLKQSVYSDQRKTFFVEWGDWISKIALMLTALIILLYFFRKMTLKKNQSYA